MTKTEVTIKQAAAEVKEQANMYARGGDWDWKKVEAIIHKVAETAVIEHELGAICVPDERPNRE